MSSSFGLWVSQCEFLIKVFSCMTFKRITFHIFAPSTRNSKKILIIVVSQRQLFKDRCLLQAGFLQTNQFASCAGTRATTLKIFNHFLQQIFFGGQDLQSPVSIFMNFFVEIYTLFSAAFNCPFFLIHEKITGYLF